MDPPGPTRIPQRTFTDCTPKRIITIHRLGVQGVWPGSLFNWRVDEKISESSLDRYVVVWSSDSQSEHLSQEHEKRATKMSDRITRDVLMALSEEFRMQQLYIEHVSNLARWTSVSLYFEMAAHLFFILTMLIYVCMNFRNIKADKFEVFSLFITFFLILLDLYIVHLYK